MTVRTYSEPDRVVQAVRSSLASDATLAGYVASFTALEDEYTLEETGKFPYINIEIQDVQIEELPGIPNIKSGERRKYPVIILLCSRNKVKSKVKRGDDTTYGVYDMYEHVKDCIYADRTFGGVTNGVTLRPTFSCDVSRHLSTEWWIGRAMMIFETCIDELF